MLGDRLQMYAEQLRTDPVGFVIYMCYYACVVLFSLIIHECAHGYVALRCGDPTARMLGRLSLNPKNHLDPLGTVFMFVVGLGWARPVPINPQNFRHPRRDRLLVSLAGVTVNMAIFLICAALTIGVNQLIWTQEFHGIIMEEFEGSLEMMVNQNHGWSLVFDDTDYISAGHVITEGHRLAATFPEFIQHGWLLWVQRLLLMLVQVNLSLAIFNLLPIPPLDGFHVLNDTILGGRMRMSPKVFRIAQAALLVLCITGILGKVLFFLIDHVSGFVYGLMLSIAGLG